MRISFLVILMAASMQAVSAAETTVISASSFAQEKLPLSFPVARTWLYERSDKLKASSAAVRSKEETRDSLKTLGGPTVSVQAVQIAGQKKIDIHKDISLPMLGTLPIGLDEKLSLNGPRDCYMAYLHRR